MRTITAFCLVLVISFCLRVKSAAALLEISMLDLIFMGVTVAFFVIAIGYVRVCEKLR